MNGAGTQLPPRGAGPEWVPGPPVIGVPPAPKFLEAGTFRASDPVGESVLSFDAEEGKAPSAAEVVIVRPGESANRRVYTESAIAEAVANGFWDGSKMFADHGDSKMPTHRSINSLLSRITSTRLGKAGETDAKGRSLQGAAIGTVKFLRPEFATFAREAEDAIGVSIVHQFQGQRYKGTDGLTHERVDHFITNYSVDWVAYPAAGGGLLQFLPGSEGEGEDDVEWSELTADMIKSHAPHVAEAIRAEAIEELEDGMAGNSQAGTEPGVAGSGTSLTAEQIAEIASTAATKAVGEALAERDKQQAARQSAQEQIAAIVNASPLPEKARLRVIASFAGAESFDETAVNAAVESMQTLIKDLGGRGPRVSGLGGSESTETQDAAPSYGQSYPAMAAFESVTGIKQLPVSEGH